jgi:16S rRNA (adenine1518-N6/adenine1519-N6)-dimethyltransferase
VLLRLIRRGPAPPPELRAFVRGAFAHRRKTLAGSLALSIGIDPDRVRSALVGIGKPRELRAESLAPSELRLLWEAL